MVFEEAVSEYVAWKRDLCAPQKLFWQERAAREHDFEKREASANRIGGAGPLAEGSGILHYPQKKNRGVQKRIGNGIGGQGVEPGQGVMTLSSSRSGTGAWILWRVGMELSSKRVVRC